jgi:RHS repeat-associated protein
VGVPPDRHDHSSRSWFTRGLHACRDRAGHLPSPAVGASWATRPQNPHTDVETLTGTSGDTKATYAYTAYGADDTAGFTGADKPGAATPDAEPVSAYRFNGMRLDSGSGEYDMGFQDYAPALNRFLTRDTYDGALSDLSLAADPYTGNRYAFASGNPISRIELDGHCWGPQWMCDVAGGIVDTVTAPVTGLISTITGAGAAIACPSAVGYATAGTACNGVQESVTTSVQNQYNDLLDLGGHHGSLGWRAGQVIGAVGLPGATATRAAAAAAAAAARAAARRAAEAAARRTATRAADRIAAKTADDWPIHSEIVRDATRGKGNYGLGSGTASQATRAGESWVGEGYRIASDGKTLVSRDGLRTFRPPTWKPNEGKYQANFEYWIGERVGKPFANGHLDITEMGP